MAERYIIGNSLLLAVYDLKWVLISSQTMRKGGVPRLQNLG
jgi:hypothetical protein